ncbi:MAG: stage II sporulation protein R [Oscillospiraceae bacterium]|nr:stage II sporulation protein R [Oscillospiraceae bacterium]
MKKIELAMLIGMIIAVFSTGMCSFAEEYEDITDTVFRLHILANSDSDEDQQLKLKVRDAVLEECSYLFENCKNAEESASVAEENMDFINSVAQRTVDESGKDYSVKCEVAEMHFDTRIYESVTMPAGDYSALRITIGEAEGKNWWCVMFPPLCIPVATGELEDYDGVFTAEEIEMLNNPENYECKFYILELLDKLEKYLSDEIGECANENL